MTKKLYEATITIYVMAESPVEAALLASRHGEDEPFTGWEIEEAEAIDIKWWSAIPYGGEDDKTCREIFLLNLMNSAENA